jgi:hypothetical protein
MDYDVTLTRDAAQQVTVRVQGATDERDAARLALERATQEALHWKFTGSADTPTLRYMDDVARAIGPDPAEQPRKRRAIIIARGHRDMPMKLNQKGLLVWHNFATEFASTEEAKRAIRLSMALAKKQGIDQKWLRMKVIPVRGYAPDITKQLAKHKEALHGTED